MRDEKKRMLGAVESGLFASKLGANMRGQPRTIDAIGDAKEKAPENEPRTVHVASCLQRPMPWAPTEETGSSTAERAGISSTTSHCYST